MKYYVYVIDLDKKVLEKEKKFKDANSQYTEGKPCVYIGQSSKSPEDRFKQHREGGRLSNKYARLYGRWLKQKNIPDKNPHTSRSSAEDRENELAKILKARGWAVWWN